MANRYWVGGSLATWDTTTTTNWSATSGGAGGASVPTASDSVFFDRAGTFNVAMTGALACLDITVSAGTVSFINGTSPTLTISGSMSLLAGTTWSMSGSITFNSTTTGKTVTTNGVSFNNIITFNGVGGGWTLGSALTNASSITLTAGTLDTSAAGNYALTCSTISATSASTAQLRFNASTITLSGTASHAFTGSGLTLNAGTSQINITSTGSVTLSGALTGAGKTFYNVNFSGAATAVSTTRTINGINTFNNLTFAAPANGLNGPVSVVYNANQTINSTFSGSGSSESVRISHRSGTFGTAVVLTMPASTVTSYADFRDITAGTNSITATTSGGDCGGNTNITFPAAKTVYWNLTGSQNWSAVAWASSSGGSPAAANFPLAQDTAIFDDTGAATTVTMAGLWNVGTVNMSGRTSAMTIQVSIGPKIYGDWSFGTGVTVTAGSATYEFMKRGGTQTVTCYGKSFGSGSSVLINNIGGTVRLADAFSVSVGGSGFLQLVSGTLDLQTYTATCGRFLVDNTGVGSRVIAFGTGNITATNINGGQCITLVSTNFSYTGTPTINMSSAGSTATTITTTPATGGWTATNSCNINVTAGTYVLTFLSTSGDGVLNVNFTGFAGTWNGPSTSSGATIYGDLTLSTGMTVASSANAITFGSTSATPRNITTNGKTINFGITFNGVGGTWTLQDALTVVQTRLTTLTNGTLNLNGFTLTTGLFNSNNSNTRTLAFGTGNITVNGTATVWNTNIATGLTTSGTQVVNVANNTATAATISLGAINEANSISFNVVSGTYTLSLNVTGGTTRNLDFTGFSGTLSIIGNTVVYGNLLLSTGMSISGSTQTITFAATSGTKTITSNGKVLNYPIIFNGVGGTWALQDALSIATNTLTQTNGTLDLNGKTATISNYTTNAGTKNLTFNAGTLVCTNASATAFNNANSTGFTTTAGTGTGTISMTAATAKTFAGGGSTYNCTLNQGGAGALTITGANTFANITNTVQPAIITFPASITTTFNNFSLSGTAGNLITINSSSAGTQATLSKASGSVDVVYCSITDTNATGGSAWNSLLTNGNVDGGNNTGWFFSSSISVSVNVTGVFASGTLDTATVAAAANIQTTGPPGTGNVGTVDIATGASATLTGISATGSLGSVVINAGTSFAVTNVEATGAIGTVDTTSGASAALTGIFATGETGTALVSAGAAFSVTGVSAAGAIGNVDFGIGINIFPTGVEGSGQLGTVDFQQVANVSVTGVVTQAIIDGVGVSAGGSISVDPNDAAMVGSVGTVTVTTITNVQLTGVTGTAQLGTVEVTAAANAEPTGVVGTGALGTPVVSAQATVPVTNVEATGAIGTVQTTAGANATTTGVEGAGQTGTASVSAKATTTVTGVQATGQTGTVNVTTSANAGVTGVQGTGSVGTASVSAGATTSVTGVSATGEVNTVVVSIPVRVSVTGVSATVSLGTANATGSSNVVPIGVQGIGRISHVQVWSIINDNQTPNWQPVDDAQAGSWVQVNDGNTVTWVDIPT